MKVPKSFWLIAPYAAWMVLMTALPATAAAYAVRTAVVAALLAAWWVCGGRSFLKSGLETGSPMGWRVLFGLLVGVLVFIVWILPEQFGWEWYGKWCIVGEGGTRAVSEAGAAMIAVRLIGSAFVVSVAEELFFRRWLIGFAGFWWMVVLFAIEHDRWLVGAVAGIVYGLLYQRRGLLSATVAHATTNLALGFWVLESGQWQFW